MNLHKKPRLQDSTAEGPLDWKTYQDSAARSAIPEVQIGHKLNENSNTTSAHPQRAIKLGSTRAIQD